MSNYHKIMANEFEDRGGFFPMIPGKPQERLEREHDWCLLLFARSSSMQAGAEMAAKRIAAMPGTVEREVKRRIALVLCGQLKHDRHCGYITMEASMEVLATGLYSEAVPCES